LWAVLPFVAIVLFEKIVFNTMHFARLIGYRFTGPEIFSMHAAAGDMMTPLTTFALGKFLSTPGLWLGFAAAALFLAAAVRLRRYRDPV
jgi:ABC-2 type transport system permease protein